MNNILIILFTLLLGTNPGSVAVPEAPVTIQDEAQNPVNVLMKDLTKYYVVILWKGPNWSASSRAVIEKRLSESHQWKDLVKSGKLVGIVRVTGETDCKFLGFLKTDSKEDAWAAVDSLQSVKEKLFAPEIYHIWGTRGMGARMQEELSQGNRPEKRESLYFSLFKKGRNWKAEAPDDTTRAWASRHAEAVLKWKNKGTLKFYGIVDDVGPLRVMGIFSAKSIDEAKNNLSQMPTVKGEWYTPATYSCSVLEGILP